MARLCSPNASACLTLLLLLVPAAAATSYSSLCHYPAPARDDRHGPAGPLLLPGVATGHFSGGRGFQFVPDQSHIRRSFSFFPALPARPTEDPAVLHLFYTLTLEGTRLVDGGDPRQHSVSFELEGYYSTAMAASSGYARLCMVGTGSYAREDRLGVVFLHRAVLHLSLPHPPSLSRPFVTGRLEGADFGDVSLVAYAGSKYDYNYKDGQEASCPPPPAAVGHGSRQVVNEAAAFSCRRLRALLQSSYRVEYTPPAAAGHAATTSSPLSLHHRRMDVNQMNCGAHGAVSAYMVFDTNRSAAGAGAIPLNYTYSTARWPSESIPDFLVGEEALVADGFWDSPRGQLCLRACRVERSGPSRADLAVRDCGIGVRFWFPAVWSIRDRSAVTATIWNTSTAGGDGGSNTGVISVSRTASYMDDLSNITYNYTRVEEARKHYHANHSLPALSKERNTTRFPGDYSYRDFAFSFYVKNQGLYGYASPVTIGSALVQGDRLAADVAFSGHGAADMRKQRLLNVSYDLQCHEEEYGNASGRISPPARSPLRRRFSAEGVYDTSTGSLCMVACSEARNGSSADSWDCEILVTVQFAPVNAVGSEHAAGTIRSLRKQGDALFFEALDLVAEGMLYAEQVSDSVSRMDTESAMVVVSMALSCAFTALQLRHAKRHPEALPATSITMLAVLALGYAVPLVLNLEDEFGGRRRGDREYLVQLTSGGWLELNQFVLRASAMLAFVLQLRLLQLAVSRRASSSSPDHQAAGRRRKHEDHSPPPSDAEGSTLWVCLPLYALGAAVVWIAHMSDDGDGGRHGRFFHGWRRARAAGALVDDLAAYAGLVLDGFLLPQVVWNALSGSSVRALSPWFYAGGSAVRAAPHVYDALRRRSYAPSWRASDVYAGPRDDLFGVAWDVAVPCGVALLAALLFLQQRLGGSFLCCLKSRS